MGDDRKIRLWDYSGPNNDTPAETVIGGGNWGTVNSRNDSRIALDVTIESRVATIMALQEITVNARPGTLFVFINRCPVLDASGSNFSAPKSSICKALVVPVAKAHRALRNLGVTRFFGICRKAAECIEDALGGVWHDEMQCGAGWLRR